MLSYHDIKSFFSRTWIFYTVMVAVIFLASFLPFVNSLYPNGFISDDATMIANNPYIKDLSNIHRVFTIDWYHDVDAIEFFLYRPLTLVTYAFNFYFGQLNVIGYHLVNVLLHTANSILVFIFCSYIFRRRFIAVSSSLIFAVHPIHTEAVNWLVGRAELMSLFFILITSIFYIKYSKNRRLLYLAISLIAFLAGLLSKESSIVLLGFIPLIDIVSRINLRKKLMTYVAFGGVALSWVVWREIIVKVFDPVDSSSAVSQIYTVYNNALFILPWFERTINAVKILVFYSFKLLVLPINLSYDYSYNSIPLSDSVDLSVAIAV